MMNIDVNVEKFLGDKWFKIIAKSKQICEIDGNSYSVFGDWKKDKFLAFDVGDIGNRKGSGAIFRPDSMLVTPTEREFENFDSISIIAFECCGSWQNLLQKRFFYYAIWGDVGVKFIYGARRDGQGKIDFSSTKSKNVCKIEVIYIMKNLEWNIGYARYCPSRDFERFCFLDEEKMSQMSILSLETIYMEARERPSR